MNSEKVETWDKIGKGQTMAEIVKVLAIIYMGGRMVK